MHIYERYIKSLRFKVDLIALLPYEIMCLVVGTWQTWRVGHLLRILALPRYLNDLKQHFEDVKSILLNSGFLTVCQMILATVIVSHWSR